MVASSSASVKAIARRVTWIFMFVPMLVRGEGVMPNVEVTGAARLYRAASVWTAGLERI